MEKDINILDVEAITEELKCPICFNILKDPVMELPNQHIMCNKCLLEFNKTLNKNYENNEENICPFCKKEITQLIKPRIIITLLNSVEMKCKSEYQNEKCDWKGKAIDYYEHLKNCEIHKKEREGRIKNECNKMREILDKEINPHLKSEHLTIFNEHVKEWEWLENDKRDWKWWWWCNMPWWENKSCKECNILWHKYEDEIQVYETKRICFLNED